MDLSNLAKFTRLGRGRGHNTAVAAHRRCIGQPGFKSSQGLDLGPCALSHTLLCSLFPKTTWSKIPRRKGPGVASAWGTHAGHDVRAVDMMCQHQKLP